MFFFMQFGHEMIKHGFSKEEMVWMRLKLPKVGFLLDLSNLKSRQCRDVYVSHHDMDHKPKKCRDMDHKPRKRHDMKPARRNVGYEPIQRCDMLASCHDVSPQRRDMRLQCHDVGAL